MCDFYLFYTILSDESKSQIRRYSNIKAEGIGLSMTSDNDTSCSPPFVTVNENIVCLLQLELININYKSSNAENRLLLYCIILKLNIAYGNITLKE